MISTPTSTEVGEANRTKIEEAVDLVEVAPWEVEAAAQVVATEEAVNDLGTADHLCVLADHRRSEVEIMGKKTWLWSKKTKSNDFRHNSGKSNTWHYFHPYVVFDLFLFDYFYYFYQIMITA